MFYVLAQSLDRIESSGVGAPNVEAKGLDIGNSGSKFSLVLHEAIASFFWKDNILAACSCCLKHI